MPKVNNIASTAHSQHVEMKALLGTPAGSAELQAQVEALTAELAAEKEAHAATQAALAAATATTATPAA